jgi:hypothetical protein
MFAMLPFCAGNTKSGHRQTRDAWTEEHFGRLRDFRAQRLPEVKGFLLTTDARDSAGDPPSRIMVPVGISLLGPEEDEPARGLTAVAVQPGPRTWRCWTR